MGVDLVFDDQCFETIKAIFTKRNRVMPERNRVQAFLPNGAEFIPNSLGTAPGLWAQVGAARVACLPGVPSEMKPMFEQWVMPRLGLGERRQWIRRIHAFGAGESTVDERLQGITARGREPEVGITASGGVITLRIVANADNEAAANAVIAPIEVQIRERLGDLVFGIDDEKLSDAVAQLLVAQKKTIATAESITAGQVAQLLARTPGASGWLRGGVIAYVNAAKTKILGVQDTILRANGAVSAEVAAAMAEGARRHFEADIAISTTGLAGPSDGGEGKPLGLCFIGVAWNGGSLARQVNWFGTRIEIQSRAAHSALDFARLWLQGKLT
jgi:nicotinamide-nucleotide amidase